jgi:hypothetical protein
MKNTPFISEEIEGAVIKAFAEATRIPAEAVRNTVLDANESKIDLQGECTNQTDSTATRLSISEVKRGEFRFEGSIISSIKNVTIEKSVQSSPEGLPSLVRSILATSRVQRSALQDKIGKQLKGYLGA